MSSSDSARTRAAASSIASGIPSRRLQISSTVAEFASVTTKSGRTRRARSANRSIASSPIDSDGTRNVTSPGTPSGSRLVASSRSAGQAPSSSVVSAADASRRCSQLSTTINTRRSPMARTTPLYGRSAGLVGQTERTRDRDRDDLRMRDRRQVDVVHAVGEGARRCGQRSRRRAASCPHHRTGQVHQPVAFQQPSHLVHLCAAADEAGERRSEGWAYQRLSTCAAAETRCRYRGGTAAQPARVSADRATRGCPAPSATHRRAGSRRPAAPSPPTTTSDRRVRGRAGAPSG